MSIQEPGEASSPQDTQGDGPVTLSDRTEPGGQGSPGSNQAQAEPVSPPGTPAPELVVPDLEDMNVGGADPQAPRHPDALRSGTSATGAYAEPAPGQAPTRLDADGSTPEAHRGAADTTASTGSTGTAHRAPGLLGTTPDGESVTTDTAAGAARMGPQALDSTPGTVPGQGDDASVPTSGTAPAEGTSQEHQVVKGIRLPEGD